MRGHGSQPSQAAHWHLTLVLLAILVGMVSCATERRYRVLSFVFDGVPDPNAPVVAEEADKPEADRGVAALGPVDVPGPMVASGSFHPPYVAHECEVCHVMAGAEDRGRVPTFMVGGEGAPTGSLVEPAEQLCVMCHGEFEGAAAAAEGLWLHGPVGAGACTYCHNPHRSPNKRLLRAAQPRVLCLQCHDATRLDTNEDHPPLEELEGEDCTECHNPHQGTTRFLL